MKEFISVFSIWLIKVIVDLTIVYLFIRKAK